MNKKKTKTQEEKKKDAKDFLETITNDDANKIEDAIYRIADALGELKSVDLPPTRDAGDFMDAVQRLAAVVDGETFSALYKAL